MQQAENIFRVSNGEAIYTRSMLVLLRHLKKTEQQESTLFSTLRLKRLSDMIEGKQETSFGKLLFDSSGSPDILAGLWKDIIQYIYIAALYLETYWPESDKEQGELLAPLRQAREAAGAMLAARGFTPHRLHLPVNADWQTKHAETRVDTTQMASDELTQVPGFQDKLKEFQASSHVYAEIAFWGYEFPEGQGKQTALIEYAAMRS